MKVSYCYQLSLDFSVQQQATLKRNHTSLCGLEMLNLYNYISIEISGESRISQVSFFDHAIFFTAPACIRRWSQFQITQFDPEHFVT